MPYIRGNMPHNRGDLPIFGGKLLHSKANGVDLGVEKQNEFLET